MYHAFKMLERNKTPPAYKVFRYLLGILTYKVLIETQNSQNSPLTPYNAVIKKGAKCLGRKSKYCTATRNQMNGFNMVFTFRH